MYDNVNPSSVSKTILFHFSFLLKAFRLCYLLTLVKLDILYVKRRRMSLARSQCVKRKRMWRDW
jgi:hypothetical protein